MSAGPVRVLYLAHSFQVGGAEEMVLTLTRHLPNRFAPRVCCITTAGPIGEEIQRSGAPCDVLGLNPGIRRPQDVVKLRRYLARTKPHIVHTFLLTASLYGRFAAKLASVPVVIGTEVNIYANKRRAHIVAERVLMAATDCVVASAESVRDFYIEQVQADPGRVKVIYNAVDWSALEATMTRAEVRRAVALPENALVITIIARLTEQKAHRVLFDALAMNKTLRDVHVLVVGDGELRDDLKNRASKVDDGRRIHFVGARRDLGNLLTATDVFVMPSLWEGLPLSLVLAMGAGVPVVATTVAGIPEVVRHGRTGLLVEPGDPAALGSALASLVHDGNLRVTLGSAGRDFVRPRFGADHYVAAVTDLYDSLLAAKGIA